MTKAELIERAVAEVGTRVTKKDAALIVNAFLEATKAALAGGRHIEIRGLGTFTHRERKPRPARNLQTGERLDLDGRAIVIFRPSRELRTKVDSGPAA